MHVQRPEASVALDGNITVVRSQRSKLLKSSDRFDFQDLQMLLGYRHCFQNLLITLGNYACALGTATFRQSNNLPWPCHLSHAHKIGKSLETPQSREMEGCAHTQRIVFDCRESDLDDLPHVSYSSICLGRSFAGHRADAVWDADIEQTNWPTWLPMAYALYSRTEAQPAVIAIVSRSQTDVCYAGTVWWNQFYSHRFVPSIQCSQK